MTVKFTWTADQWAKSILPAINAGVTAAAQTFADGAVKMLNGPSPSPPGSPPGHDTGQLSDSIAYCSPESLGTPMRAAFGTSKMYGRHLEFGAIVRPRTAKALAIPVDRAAVQTLNRAGNRVRNIPGLIFIKSHKSGTIGVLANKDRLRVHVRGLKSKSRSVPAGSVMFVLRKQSVIQPRPWILRTAFAYSAEAQTAFQTTVKSRLVADGLVKP